MSGSGISLSEDNSDPLPICLVRLSRRYFCFAFKHTTRKSFISFRDNCRLDCEEIHLYNSDISMFSLLRQIQYCYSTEGNTSLNPRRQIQCVMLRGNKLLKKGCTYTSFNTHTKSSTE